VNKNSGATFQKSKIYFTGFDYLRAVFSLTVVVLHGGGLGFIKTINPELEFISKLINQNILHLAVPVFLQISLFLFYKKYGITQVTLLVKDYLDFYLFMESGC
jgi:peptidoglycan/LPS O-acetylase OafA/YrhL